VNRDNKWCILTIDYYSKFFENDLLANMLYATIIQKLRFTCHGICDICISDNTDQFNPDEFKRFAHDFGFQHQTPSPLYSHWTSNTITSISTLDIKHHHLYIHTGHQAPSPLYPHWTSNTITSISTLDIKHHHLYIHTGHQTPSPLYPHWNALSERGVGIAKKIIK